MGLCGGNLKSRLLRIEMESSLHHGSGFGLSGIVDRAVLRDIRGVPYLAGSSIKGRLRHAALRVLLAEGQSACHTGDRADWCNMARPCPLCRVFGSPRRKGALIFCDAYPADGMEVLLEEMAKLPKPSGLYRDTQLRARTAIDRELRTVRPQALFTTEVLPDYFVFEGRLLGPLQDDRPLLEKACLVITHFGADAARGLGQCKFKLLPETGA